MHFIHKLVSCWCLFVVVNALAGFGEDNEIREAFEKYMIIPQCIPNPPKEKLTIIFNNKEVYFGKEIHPFDTVMAPFVTYPASTNSLYTLVQFDPDLPFLYLPLKGQLLQDMIVNIPGRDVQRGDRVAVYVPQIPCPGSGYHRSVFLVYKQPSRIKITVDLRISMSTNLTNFDVYTFAKTYGLGDPVAGNFFVAKLTMCDLIHR